MHPFALVCLRRDNSSLPMIESASGLRRDGPATDKNNLFATVFLALALCVVSYFGQSRQSVA